MNILIVGGTGLVGSETARYLKAQGHEVTLMSRKPAAAGVPAQFPHRAFDYIEQDATPDMFAGFDGVVFAAGADIRYVPEGADIDAFYLHANGERVPAFMAAVKAAGVPSAVYISSFYPLVAPELIETNTYVRSRHLADEAVMALADENFRVCGLNAPFILGHIEGVPAPHLDYIVAYAAGQLEGVPLVAPKGGVNHISSLSVAEAIADALQNGKPGRAYLIGDENLDWKTYFEIIFEAAGNPQDLPVSEDEHPLLPDAILFCGRNATVHFEPDEDAPAYGRQRIRETIQQLVAACAS